MTNPMKVYLVFYSDTANAYQFIDGTVDQIGTHITLTFPSEEKVYVFAAFISSLHASRYCASQTAQLKERM